MSDYEIGLRIAKKIINSGFKAYFAGGCVRDRLMGVMPKDYDIATDALPTDIIKLFKKTVPVGIEYGVVLVLEEGIPFEVTTFRSDGEYVDGRHPKSVSFSKDPKEDKKKDFLDKGFLEWRFMLKPGKKKEIGYTFTVIYPSNMAIEGI